MDRFFFYSGSADKGPGKGVNEYVQDVSKYGELSLVPNWRRILSNFHIGPFFYQDPITNEMRRYNTAEHAFQGIKINIANQPRGYLFSLDSGSALSKGTGEDARRERKVVILNPSQLGQWNRMKDQVLEGILYAKFSQVPLAQKVLLATKGAILEHGTRGVQKERQLVLEKVRERLYKDPSIQARSILEGNTYAILTYINKDNIIGIMAHMRPKDKIPPGSYQAMQSEDLSPDIFQALLSGDISKHNTLPTFDIWKKLLANSIHIDNAPLVLHLILLYKDRISPEMVQKMKQLAIKSPESMKLIQSL